MQVHTRLDHLLGYKPARLFVKAPQNLRSAIKLRHLHAQAIENTGELTGDITAPDDQNGFWQAFKMKDVIAGDGMFGPWKIGFNRAPAGGDQDMLGAFAAAIRQLDSMRIKQPCPRVKTLDAVGLENAAIDIFKPVQLGMQLALKHRPVKAPGMHGPAIGLRIGDRCGIFRGKHHQLFRHTAADHTGAAIAVLFGQGHFCAALCGHARRAHPARAATDHEKIIVECHAAPGC